MTFRIENLVAADKRKVISSYQNLEKRVGIADNKKSSLANLESANEINQSNLDKTFATIPMMSSQNSTEKFSRQSTVLENSNDLYFPRIFSVAGANVTLELCIGIQNKKHVLVLEVALVSNS